MAEENLQSSEVDSSRSRYEWLIVIVIAIALTIVFWWAIWQGGGLIGGDLYTYFMPQKQFLADRLHDGEFPLWNNRTSFGYPVVAESQTGGLYPPHYVLYRLFDINTAYNINQLLHYVFTFVFTWLFAREVGANLAGALLAALVYTYGWFPSRICLEWTIIGGCYFPLVLWFNERFLKTCQWRYLIYSSIAVGVQLSAGHYNLAFITMLTLVVYVPARIFYAKDNINENISAKKTHALGLVAAAIVLGFTLAAVKLLPTWELKHLSQRSDITKEGEFDPGYGHIPPMYMTQTVASWWFWYAPEIDRDKALIELSTLPNSAGTNQVEAHLFFGSIPLLLIVIALASPRVRLIMFSGKNLTWFCLAICSTIIATGLMLWLTNHLPGFSFFRGPGRYGIVTTLCVALLSGVAFTHLTRSSRLRWVIFAAVFGLTTVEFHYVSRVVTYATILETPALEYLEQKGVHQLLAQRPQARLLYAPMPNVTNLLEVSSVPEYLGIGPAEYYEPTSKPPELKVLNQEIVDWGRQHGVTHILTLSAVPIQTSDLRLLYGGPDPFLDRTMARKPGDPLFLWEIIDAPGRVIFSDANPENSAEITRYAANHVEMKVSVKKKTYAVLTDLMYPGWEVEVDGKPAQARQHKGLFRAVEVSPGTHTVHWAFRPLIFTTGAIISGISLVLLLTVAHFRFLRFQKGEIESPSTEASTSKPTS